MSKKIIVRNCQECPYLSQVSSRTKVPQCLHSNRELAHTDRLDMGVVVKAVTHCIPLWCKLDGI